MITLLLVMPVSTRPLVTAQWEHGDRAPDIVRYGGCDWVHSRWDPTRQAHIYRQAHPIAVIDLDCPPAFPEYHVKGEPL